MWEGSLGGEGGFGEAEDFQRERVGASGRGGEVSLVGHAIISVENGRYEFMARSYRVRVGLKFSSSFASEYKIIVFYTF
jgi:hypothetical protein